MCDGFYDFFENRVQIIKITFSIFFSSVDDYLFKECVFLLLFILIFSEHFGFHRSGIVFWFLSWGFLYALCKYITAINKNHISM